MMKIRMTRQVTDLNVTTRPGEEIEVSDVVAKLYIANGWAEPMGDVKAKGAK